MSDGDTFTLDPRLAADSHFIVDGPLSQVRLVDDARYDWFVLVPRSPGAVEWFDLAPGQQRILLEEIGDLCAALQATARCEKLNIGALGNIVRQLHVHVLARNTGDPAWPGPAWGASPLQRRGEVERDAAICAWQLAFRLVKPR